MNKCLNMKRIGILIAMTAIVFSTNGGTAIGYSAEKRRIHEQMTGQRLDENGKPLREASQNDATSEGKPPRKLMASSAPLTVSNVKIAQRANSKWVDGSYTLTGGNGSLCNVSVEICDDTTCITARTFEGDIGPSIKPGKSKYTFSWNAGADWPNKFSKKVNATITATETELSEDWHTIKIKWARYGGYDLDICGYWENNRTDNVGWSWGNGSVSGAYQSKWYGDNTESGPEQIDVRISKEELAREKKKRKYKIHFNYYGGDASQYKADVEVDGKLSQTQKASMRFGNRATSSDPCLTITFDETGNPISID